ncbi:unnamed protein product, partial [Rotaria sp. Silwood2]
IINDYDKDCVIKNPYYHIKIGNDLLINDSLFNENYEDAMKHFDRAIELDEKHTAGAFYGKGWLLLRGMKKFILPTKQDINYKDIAIAQFNNALAILSEEIATLTTTKILLEQRYSHILTSLSKQLFQKVNILTTYMNSIERAITVIEKSQRLIQITEITENSSTETNQNNERGVLKEIVSHAKFEKKNGKWCDIYLTTADELDRHLSIVREQKEIFVVVEDENKFSIRFKQKGKDEYESLIKKNQHLIDSLPSLEHEKMIIPDRSKYSRVYTLIYEAVKSKNGYVQQDFLQPFESLKDSKAYEVAFNDLTVRQDCGSIDQAIETIDCAVSENQLNRIDHRIASSIIQTVSSSVKQNVVLSSTYRHISISITQINAGVLKEFLNPHIEIQEVTKQLAISYFKDKSSFFHRHILPENWFSDSCKVDLEIKTDNKTLEKKSSLQIRKKVS